MADRDHLLKRAVYFILPVFILVAVDQMTKHYAVLHLKDQAPYILVSNILEFRYVENRGAAFGMLNGMRWGFLLLSAVICLFMFLWFIHIGDVRRLIPFKASLIGISAGALGNAADRLRLGYVVDFIYFKPINFPVFNFADICVTCSAALLIILIIFIYREDELKQIPFLGRQ